MNFLDYIILALLIWGFIAGFRKGLISILCTLAGTIIGAVLALKHMHTAGDYLVENLGLGLKLSEFIGFLLIFLVVYIAFFFLGKALSKAVSLVMLGFVNRLSGGIFGMVKYLVFISVFLSLSNHFKIELLSDEMKASSTVFASVHEVSEFISPEIDKIKGKDFFMDSTKY